MVQGCGAGMSAPALLEQLHAGAPRVSAGSAVGAGLCHGAQFALHGSLPHIQSAGDLDVTVLF